MYVGRNEKIQVVRAEKKIVPNSRNLALFFKANCAWSLRYYGLSNFQSEGTKLERFLPKNQHTQMKLLNFGLMAGCQK